MNNIAEFVQKYKDHHWFILAPIILSVAAIIISINVVSQNTDLFSFARGQKSTSIRPNKQFTINAGETAQLNCKGGRLGAQRTSESQLLATCKDEGGTRSPVPGTSQPPNPSPSGNIPVSPPPYVTPPSGGTGAFDGPTPFGPFHYGDSSTSAFSSAQSPAYNGSFMHFANKGASFAVPLLDAARANGVKVMASMGQSDPCSYWDGSTFNTTQLVADISALLPTLKNYYPDTVQGIQILNEPHNPSRCTVVPVRSLYDAAKQIRTAMAANGMAGALFGYNTPATFIEGGLTAAESQDGTIDMAFIQWHNGKGAVTSWATNEKAAASRMSAGGHKFWLTYSTNADANGSDTASSLTALKWMCEQSDAVQVWWWSWNGAAAFKALPLADVQAVRTICDAH